jgi:soluble lytic murein transglycosylase
MVWAIMRRESAFDPTVVSKAHAVGLLQVLPSTAQRVGAALQRSEPYDALQLHQVSAELPVSTWYLAELASRFGSAALVAASYNAGPPAVSRWLDDRGDLPLDEFVEAIPFRETRMYVKNVVGDYLAYRALYPSSDAAVPLNLNLPEALPGASF